MGRCGAFVNTNDELMELMASGQTPVVAPTVENAGGGVNADCGGAAGGMRFGAGRMGLRQPLALSNFLVWLFHE